MYDWMKVDEIIWFCKGFYPDWDDDFADGLKAKLELPGQQEDRRDEPGDAGEARAAAGDGLPAGASDPRRADRGAGRGRPPRLPGGRDRADPGGRPDGVLLLAHSARGRARRGLGRGDRPAAG